MSSKISNAEKQAAYRAKKKAEKLAASTPSSTGSVPVSTPVDEGIQVTIKEEKAGPKLSLKERFLNKVKATENTSKTTKGRSKKASEDNLIVSALPSVLAALIATYAQSLLPDEYKVCAPSQQEVSAILQPIMNILGRQVEVVGKVSQNAIDLLNSLICALMYGTRAYITYIDIKKSKEIPGYYENKQKQHEDYRQKLEREAREYNEEYSTSGYSVSGGVRQFPSESTDASLATGLRAYQNASNGLNRDTSSGYASPTNVNPAETYVTGSNPTTEDGDTERAKQDAALVSNMFARDKRGRQQLGLLPR